ncbi:MAG TPA: murein biosynthesis integral membrane protein MurJ [Thermomicrobiaceae bacterium]|nr:murein biosynthesis integral membrane protein MurJ [Thermomicrobiaceae bacterium]
MELTEPAADPPRPRSRPRTRLSAALTREYSISEGAIILMASFFFSAMLGAVRQVLFNAQFGAGNEASAYYAAFRLPDGLFALIAGGALSGAMIPVLVSTEREAGAREWQRLINVTLTTLLAIITLVVFAAALATPAFVSHVLAPGFDRPTTDLTVRLTRIMLLQPLILAVGSVAVAILNSRAQFLLPALSIASHNLALIAGILATWIFPGLGILGPTLGVVAGALIQVLILLPGLRGDHVGYRPRWDPHDARLREVIALTIPNGLAVTVEYAGGILDTAFASKAESAALSAIHNAWLLAALPLSLLGVAIAQSTFPHLAAHAAARQWTRLRGTLLRSLGVALLLVIPAILGLVLVGRFLVRILFQHGRYDAAAGTLTYDVLAIYALGLPAYVALEVLARGMVAMKDTRTPLLTNLARLGLRGVLLVLLIQPLGAVAIPAAFAASALFESLLLGVILLSRLRRGVAREVVSLG